MQSFPSSSQKNEWHCIGEPPCHLAAMNHNIEGASDDQVNVVVTRALFNHHGASLNRNQIGGIGNPFRQLRVASDNLLLPERIDQSPPAAFASKSLYHLISLCMSFIIKHLVVMSTRFFLGRRTRPKRLKASCPFRGEKAKERGICTFDVTHLQWYM
jgi:hypothetical protein